MSASNDSVSNGNEIEENSRDVEDSHDGEESRDGVEEDSRDVEDSRGGGESSDLGEDTNGADDAEDDDEVVEIKQDNNGAHKEAVDSLTAAADLAAAADDVDVAVVVVPKDKDHPATKYATNGEDAQEIIAAAKNKRARNVDDDGNSVDPALAPCQPKQARPAE